MNEHKKLLDFTRDLHVSLTIQFGDPWNTEKEVINSASGSRKDTH